MTDDAETIYELGDRVARDAAKFADAAARPLPGSAEDESGLIEVRLDDDGAVAVTIAEGWRSAYDSDELADGVIQAFQRLAAARTAGWVANLDDAGEVDRPNTPTPPAREGVAGRVEAALRESPDAAAEMETMLENLLGFLDDVSANFDSTFEQAVTRGSAARQSAPGSGHLRLEATSTGELLALHLDPDWVDRSPASQLSREITAALAQARAEGVSTERPLDGTPLADYQRFTDDPDAFVRFIRGKD